MLQLGLYFYIFDIILFKLYILIYLIYIILNKFNFFLLQKKLLFKKNSQKIAILRSPHVNKRSKEHFNKQYFKFFFLLKLLFINNNFFFKTFLFFWTMVNYNLNFKCIKLFNV